MVLYCKYQFVIYGGSTMVRIITDSAADFEPEEFTQKRITCIALTVMFGDTEYQENISLNKKQFYDLLASSKTLPKTAQASPQVLLDLFEDAKQAGDEAIYICLSSALSGTYQNAIMAKQLVDCDNCYVVDSLNGTGGQRMVVEHAVKLRDQGKTAAEIIEGIEQMRSRIVLYACMDTLENLYLGGRISQTVYTLGTLAQIKPIIQVNQQGQVIVPAKAMGMRKGIDYLCKQIEKHEADPDFPFYVMYTSDRAATEPLVARVRQMGYDIPDERIIQVGAAIGAHVGPNAIGFVYVS